MIRKVLLATLLFSLTLSVNAQDWWSKSKKVIGSKNIVTINRTTKEYNDIAAAGSFDVLLVKGKEGKITIQGEENIIPFIETEVSGENLKIKYKKNISIRTTKRVTVTVTFKDIESISLGGSDISSKETIHSDNFRASLGGSGNIELNIDSETMRTAIGGSGTIKLSGSANELTCSIAGSGSIRAYDLKTAELNASIAGSGNIRATVKNKIKAKLVGSGSIYYKGNPKNIDSKSVGSGSVIERN